jgi:hypothetical protein
LVLNCHISQEYLPLPILRNTAHVWHLQDTVATDIMGQGKYVVNLTLSSRVLLLDHCTTILQLLSTASPRCWCP